MLRLCLPLQLARHMKNQQEMSAFEKSILSAKMFTKQISESYTFATKCFKTPTNTTIKNVVIVGMGGSRFPALIAQSLFKRELIVPFVICDDYDIPGFVNTETLVVLSSYSGTTEEVLNVGKKAHSTGAMVVGFCVKDSPLSHWIAQNGMGGYFFEPNLNPSGQPRMGFGYALGSILAILTKFNLINNEDTDSVYQKIIVAESQLAKRIEPMSRDDENEKNPARELAKKIANKYPYIVVAGHLIGSGNGFQNQINETSKNISSFRVIPEINHHLLEGLKNPIGHRDMAIFLFIESPLYSDIIKKRFAITKEVVRKNGCAVEIYNLQGSSFIGDVIETAVLGTFATIYLAEYYGEDPSKIPFVDFFKQELAK
jgi:glucose/mannose-6-phosphate isomerase